MEVTNMPVFTIGGFTNGMNYAIDASAGTGKTYNIVQIVDKLLQKDKDLSLEQILIVTYTEKAAGELKDRIRAKIKGVDTDNAPISTFHSFCKSTIEEFPFAVNKPSNLSLIDDSKIEEFAKRYIREGNICKDIAAVLPFLKKQAEKENKKTIFNEDTLIKKLTRSCAKYYLDEKGNEDNAIITLEPYKHFEYLTFKSIDDAIAFDPAIGVNLQILKDSDNDKCKQLAGILESNCNTFNYNGNTFRRAATWIAKQNEKDAFLFFADLKDELADYQNAYNSLTAKYLKDFYMKWWNERIKNNYQTFDDMINTVRESVLMPNSVLLKQLKKKYKYAIIDEFQDTNQKQFDIFSKIFLTDDKHNIIVVGDPKQSIYSFQGADVFVYEKAINDIESNSLVTGTKNSLEKNFRSTKAMVSSCNKMFNHDDWFENFKPSTYLSIKDNKDSSEFDVLYKGQPTKAFWISDNDNITDHEYARLVAQQIIECCKKDKNGNTHLTIKDKSSNEFRNVSFKDFTVLARSRSEMGPIEKALGKAGIPYIRYKDNGLFKDSECAHWIALLQAINEPDFTGSRRNVFKKALFTDFFNHSLEEINKKKYNSDKTREVELLREWRSIINKGQYDIFIERILIDSGLVDRMTNLNDIQKLNKYRQIGDYCSDYLVKTHSLNDLINNLTYLSNGGSSDDEEGAVVQKGTDFDCVQIMTIHASKGLQFPVVISVIGFKGYNNNVENYIYHDVNNNNRQILTFNSSDQSNIERKNEMLRLLYVAYTRAQYIMLLPRYELGSRSVELQTMIKGLTQRYIDDGNEYLPIKISNTTYAQMSKEVKSMLPSATSTLAEKEQQDKVNEELIETKKDKQSYKRSYSNLSHPKKVEPEDEYDEEDNVLDLEGTQNEGLSDFDKNSVQIPIQYDEDKKQRETPTVLPKGSDIGSALHEIFEKTDFTNYSEESINDLTIQRFEHYLLPINNESKKEVFEIVDNVLQANLPIIKGSEQVEGSFKLNELKNKDKKPEIEFNTNVLKGHLNNYFNGFIDLLFKRAEIYSVLDWKSDSLNDRDFESYASLESLKEHTDNAYSIQRVLYCYFLIEWLTQKYGKDREKIFNDHFGGIYYVYLRGCVKDTSNGIYAQTWKSYADLKEAFDNIIKTCVLGGKK